MDGFVTKRVVHMSINSLGGGESRQRGRAGSLMRSLRALCFSELVGMVTDLRHFQVPSGLGR
jgi:hypothetical protein